MRIFGFHDYIHVPKDKRNKVEPSGKKGIFVGYNESSKDYRIYILEQRQIKVNQDVTFDQKVAYWKSKEVSMDFYDEVKHELSKEKCSSSIECPKKLEGPCEQAEPVVPEIRKRPTWLRSTLEEAKGHVAPDVIAREIKKPKRFSSYVTLMTNLIDAKPSIYEEAVSQQVWKEAMDEE